MYSWNSPPELKSWLKADKLQDLNHNLRSNGRKIVVPAFSKTKFGDLRFRNVFANYVNFYKLFNLNMSFQEFKKKFFLNLNTVKLSNFNKFSNRTELSRTNSILSRRTVPTNFCKKFGSVFNWTYFNIFITWMHHIQFILKFDSIEPNRTFYKKNTKIIKKFECGSPWRTRI